jgi:hypothetical protein
MSNYKTQYNCEVVAGYLVSEAVRRARHAAGSGRREVSLVTLKCYFNDTKKRLIYQYGNISNIRYRYNGIYV